MPINTALVNILIHTPIALKTLHYVSTCLHIKDGQVYFSQNVHIFFSDM